MRATTILQYRKDPRIVIAVPLLIFTATSLVYYLMQRAKELSPEALSSRLLLFALWNINLLLILGILFVLSRDVIKLVLERQRGILGSRFRTKLVVTYVATSLVPMILLFFVATDLLRVSIDRWFNTPVRRVLLNSEKIAEDAQQRAIRNSERAAEEIAKGVKSGTDLETLLDHVRRYQEVDLAGVYQNRAVGRLIANPRSPVHETSDLSDGFFDELREKQHAQKIEVTPHGKWIRTAVLVRSAPDETAAVSGIFIPNTVSRMMDENIVAAKDFQQLDSQRQAVKASQTSLFLTVTLYILFGTLWTSIYVSRRITGPVQALAEGTRTLAAGNYGHRIDFKAGDEIGLLIDSFNTMASQLDAQRRALTASNFELQKLNTDLDEDRAYFATVLDSVSTGIIAFNEELQLLSINRAALKILFMEVPPQPETRAAEIFRGELASIGAYIAALGNKEPRTRELTLIHGGEIRYVEISAARLALEGHEHRGWVIAIEDSTQLVQAQKVAAWSEAARRIAHEIKNPLTPIQLSAERIAKKFRTGGPDVAKAVEEGTRTIVNEVGQLKTMVDEFSRFARMPAVHLEQTRVETILRDIHQLYNEVKPGVNVAIECEESLTAIIDREQIRRALINLLDNAIEATDAGTIRVAARRKGKNLVMVVTDPGRGVPASDKEKLFLPYFSTKERGTGLGLAIVHRIINDHDGRIVVSDVAPRGTRFEIEIPA